MIAVLSPLWPFLSAPSLPSLSLSSPLSLHCYPSRLLSLPPCPPAKKISSSPSFRLSIPPSCLPALALSLSHHPFGLQPILDLPPPPSTPATKRPTAAAAEAASPLLPAAHSLSHWPLHPSAAVCLLNPGPLFATSPTGQKKYISAVSRCDTLGWKEITMGKKTTATRRAARRAGRAFLFTPGGSHLPPRLPSSSWNGDGESMFLGVVRTVDPAHTRLPSPFPSLLVPPFASGRHSLRMRESQKRSAKGGRGRRRERRGARQHNPRGMEWRRASSTNTNHSLFNVNKRGKQTHSPPLVLAG